MKKMCETRMSLSRSEILQAKARALRKGVWYRILTGVERACIDLVLTVVERVRSHLLSNVLFSVLRKLNAATESPVSRLMRELGGRLAAELSLIAQGWGNKSAVQWTKDSGFVQYLTIANMNSPA